MFKLLRKNIYHGFYLATIVVIVIGTMAVYLTDYNIVQLQKSIEELQYKHRESSNMASLINQVSQELIRYNDVIRIPLKNRSVQERKALEMLTESILSKIDSIETISGGNEKMTQMKEYFKLKLNSSSPYASQTHDNQMMEFFREMQKLQLKHSSEDYSHLTDWTVSGRAINFLILLPVLLFICIVLESKRRDVYFQSQRRKAEQENEAKTQFLSFITHELKTPMTTIMALSKLLKRSTLEARQLKDVEYIEDASRKQLTMIDEILQYSKLLSDQQEIEVIPFRLKEVFDEIIELFTPIVKRKALELQVELAPEIDIKVLGDPTRFKSLASNIIGNACKFTEKGGVYIRVNAGGINEKGMQEVIVEVKDTGIGIPETKIPTLFDPFSQVDVSTTRLYGGTGLGLTIAKKIVKMLEGDIRVKSQDGKGAIFIFNVYFQLPDIKSSIMGNRS